MIGLPTGTRIWLAAGVTDLRRAFTGLSGMVQTALQENPFSGSAGLNRHVAGNERVLQESSQRLHFGPQSCRRHREMSLEA